MIKVSILNLRGFLEIINRCQGRVIALSSNGEKTNITRNPPVQRELERQYQKNGKCLPLCLTFEKTEDYLAVVSYYAGDC